MFTLPGDQLGPFCDGLRRRTFLQWGAAGCLTLPELLYAEDQNRSGRSQRSLVIIYLPGGPTQHETFDPKPNAPQEIRGSFAPTSTRIPGVHFCELLPKLASISDKFAVVRTLVGMENRHESFPCYTGRQGGRPQDREPAGGWPGIGSVVSYMHADRSIPVPYVDASPKMGYGPYNNTGLHDAAGSVSWPGFTGYAHVPVPLEGAVKDDMHLAEADLPRLQQRRRLLARIGQHQPRSEGALGHYQQQAFELLTTSRVADALRLDREPDRIRQWYGAEQPTHPSFGGAAQSPQRLLLARRLIEAGVRCVTVAFGAWDWHANREGTIEQLSNKYLPLFDHALSVFLRDLEQRGLLATTTVVVWGEFGRTPRINAKGGRDHWPATQSVLLAGGGIPGGVVVGETDAHGGAPKQRPVHVQEVVATLYRNLGIDVASVKIPDLNGRPRFLVDENRRPLGEL